MLKKMKNAKEKMEQSRGWGMCGEVANKHKHLEGLWGFTWWA